MISAMTSRRLSLRSRDDGSRERCLGKRDSSGPADHCNDCRGWRSAPAAAQLRITDAGGTRPACAMPDPQDRRAMRGASLGPPK